MGPRLHWVVLESFIPRLYSGTLSSLLFGLIDFARNKTNFRFSKIHSPREPLQSRWSPTASEDFEDTLRYSLETLCPLLLQFPTTKISLWINTYTCHSYFYSQSILLIQNTPRILCAYCLAVLCHLNTPTNNISHLSSIRSSPNDSCISQKCSKYHSIFRKSSGAFLLLKFLLTCIMINLKSHNLIGISCHYHFESVDSICCESSQSSIRS